MKRKADKVGKEEKRIMDKFEWLELMVYRSLLDNFMVLVMA